MKTISKLLCVASIVAIGITAIGSGVSEAATKRATAVQDADAGRTASSYRKPLRLNGITSPNRRASRLSRATAGMKDGGLKSAPVQ